MSLLVLLAQEVHPGVCHNDVAVGEVLQALVQASLLVVAERALESSEYVAHAEMHDVSRGRAGCSADELFVQRIHLYIIVLIAFVFLSAKFKLSVYMASIKEYSAIDLPQPSSSKG